MDANNSATTRNILAGLVIGLLLVWVAYFAWTTASVEPATNTDTDDEAVVTPPDDADNTPPEDDLPEGWALKTDTATGVSYAYPTRLGTSYVTTVDWPPAIQVIDQTYACVPGGVETETAGKTAEETINGKKYCVTKESEGAAGSVYTNYAYAFASGAKTVILTFSLKTPQCANYDDPQKTTCTNEQKDFNVNELVDSIAKTVKGV